MELLRIRLEKLLKEAVKTIKAGKEIFDVSNQPFLDGVKCLNNKKFPPIILITCKNFYSE